MSKTTPSTVGISPETQGKHYEVDIRKIRPLQRAGGNIRKDYGDLTELAQSIATNGIIMPMRGYKVAENPDFDFETFDGHRRLAAGMLLLNEGVTVEGQLYKPESVRAKIIIVRADRYSDEDIILDMINTNSGKALNPVEIAEAIRRLTAYNWKPKQIAERFGKPVRYIQNLQSLAGAPKRIRDMVSNGNISYTLVGDIFRASVDYNDAIEKIEAAFGLAKTIKKPNTTPAGVDTELEDENEPDLSGVRITKKILDRATNRVDSNVELKLVFKRQIDNPSTVLNSELFTFAKKLVENKLTAADIENLLFTPKN